MEVHDKRVGGRRHRVSPVVSVGPCWLVVVFWTVIVDIGIEHWSKEKSRYFIGIWSTWNPFLRFQSFSSILVKEMAILPFVFSSNSLIYFKPQCDRYVLDEFGFVQIWLEFLHNIFVNSPQWLTINFSITLYVSVYEFISDIPVTWFHDRTCTPLWIVSTRCNFHALNATALSE